MTDADAIYCTWSHRADFPDRLQLQFGDLDDFLRRLIISAEKSLTIVAPYLSTAGLKLLTGALSVCAERAVWIRIVTQLSGDPAVVNQSALDSLLEHLSGTALRYRIRILSGYSESLFIHAKMIVADSSCGYIGSANFSARGLDHNLEIGVRLTTLQSKAVDDLIDCLESRGELIEYRGFYQA